MVALNTRFQIAAIMILLIIVIDFIKTPHLKLLSTRFFVFMLAATGLNLFFDICSVYTVNHMDQVGGPVNRIFHQLFIATVILVLYMNFAYVHILSQDQKRYDLKKSLLVAVPTVVSLFFVIFGKLEYRVTKYGAYSHGQMAYTVYICGFIYLLGVLFLSFDKKNHLTRQQRLSVRIGLVVWVGALLVQILFPFLLLSGMGFSLMILCTYLSFENQKANTDIEVGGFSRMAFHRMFAEYYENGKEFLIISVVLENYDRISSLYGMEKGRTAMQFLYGNVREGMGEKIYHSRSNVFTIFFNGNKAAGERKINELVQQLEQNPFPGFGLEIHIDILDVIQAEMSKQETYEMLGYMLQKKYKEKHRICYLDEELRQKKHREDRIDFLLEKALREQSFEVVYQPIYWPERKAFASAEALIRMKEDEELGYISPEEFIPLAEDKGYIMEIGDIVLAKVAAFWSSNHLEEYGLEYIEVNLSGIQATTRSIDNRLLGIIRKYQVSPQRINLEITETATIESELQLRENMELLWKAGFSFSMDDFGTGYSNLEQMSKVRYDLVKLDKSLIWPVFYVKEADSEDQRKAGILLRHVIEMLHELSVWIVAEGVETEEMAQHLIDAGVEHLQGYLYSKPIRESEFLKFLGKSNGEKE